MQAQKTSGAENLSSKNCALSSIPSRSPQNGDEGNLDRSKREKIHFQFSLCSEIFIFGADLFSISLCSQIVKSDHFQCLTPPQIAQIGLISQILPPPPKSARSFQISKFSPSTNLPRSSQKTSKDFCFSCNIWLLDLSRKHHHLLSTSPGDRWCVGAQK